ncbi:MAG: PEP/pyruvate-binding domain-containing protein [archaeon]
MDNILTLNKINKSDSNIVGYRAVDLANLHDKKINIPICFVIKVGLFDDFLENNNLRPEIDKIIRTIDYSKEKSLKSACDEIRELFSKSNFTEEQEIELVESYETLAIDMDHLDIAKLVTAIDKPYLTIIGSQNYVDDSENNECIFQNVKGKNSLLKHIKECWMSLYSPRALKYRNNKEILEEEKIAIIVQRMVEAEISAQTYTDEEEIIVKTFFGFQDYEDEFEKDTALFDKGTLTAKNTKINSQEHQYLRDMKNNNIIKKPLKEKGEKQKLNDKDVEEMARLTKKVEGFLEKPVKIFMNYYKNKIYILLANRVIRVKPEEANEEPIEEDAIIVPEEIAQQSEDLEEESPVQDNFNMEQDLTAFEEMNQENQQEQAPVETINEPIIEEPLEPEPVMEEIPEPIQKKVQPENESTNWTADTEEEIESEKEPFDNETTEIEQIPIGEEPIPIDDIPEKEEPEDFIFAEYEEKDEEVQEQEPSFKPKSISEKTKSIVEPKQVLAKQQMPTSKNKMDESFNMLKQILINSDDSIYNALKKKHLEMVGNEATSFEDAINGLKEKVRVPFIDEIRKVHRIREKADQGEKIEIEDSTTSLRTAKNFLNMFT